MSLNQVPVLVSTVESYYVIEAQLLQVLSPLSLVVSPMRCGKTFLWTAHDQESGLTCPPGIYVQEIPPGGYQQDTDLETTSGCQFLGIPVWHLLNLVSGLETG